VPYEGRAGRKEATQDGGEGVRGGLGKGTKRRKGKGMEGRRTRVLPVFVLSLQRPGRPPLIDSEHLFAATKDAVVVVQHGDEVSVPFFAATEQLTLKADNPSPSILAGASPPRVRALSPHAARPCPHTQVVAASLRHPHVARRRRTPLSTLLPAPQKGSHARRGPRDADCREPSWERGRGKRGEERAALGRSDEDL
jgi:hypothetical protein